MKLILFALAALAASCTAVAFNYFDPQKPHRTASGFQNNYPHAEKGGFWRWKWQQWRDGLPRRPEEGYRFEIAKADLSTNPSVTWVGHATVLLRIGGINVLTDPHFSERASPLSFAGPKRVVRAVPALAELPHIDAVVVSHNHYDHLDFDSVAKLSEQAGGSPRFFVPLGLKDWFARRGIGDVVELDWWQSVAFRSVEIHFVPVQHWSKRTLHDENQTLWGGWVVRHPELSFFFAGDTGYSKDFADIRAKFGGFDLAAIPIGAYAPRWFMQIMHLNPAEAVQVHKDVNARQSLAIHWGTFDSLTDESLYEPPQVLAAEREKAGLHPEEFLILKHGETRVLSREARKAQTAPSLAASE
jgi:N-acyl-phosphatidylethanolamine-hydrolysing phospholipase D